MKLAQRRLDVQNAPIQTVTEYRDGRAQVPIKSHADDGYCHATRHDRPRWPRQMRSCAREPEPKATLAHSARHDRACVVPRADRTPSRTVRHAMLSRDWASGLPCTSGSTPRSCSTRPARKGRRSVLTAGLGEIQTGTEPFPLEPTCRRDRWSRRVPLSSCWPQFA